MLESLINKDTIVRKEIAELVLKTNNHVLIEKIDFVLEILSKIKGIDDFISGLILLNKNNYFGTYSLGYNRDIIQAVLEKNETNFLKTFMNPSSSELFKNHLLEKEILHEIKSYYNLEKMVYFYLYQKKYYDSFYPITLDKIQELKSEIYKVKGINLNIKYFSNKNTISIRKGNETTTENIVEIIFRIFEDVKINHTLDHFIKSNYKTEYLFIKYYLERCRQFY